MLGYIAVIRNKGASKQNNFNIIFKEQAKLVVTKRRRNPKLK